MRLARLLGWHTARVCPQVIRLLLSPRYAPMKLPKRLAVPQIIESEYVRCRA